MTWCHQATSHYLSQWWPRSLSPYGIIRPWWVNIERKGCESFIHDLAVTFGWPLWDVWIYLRVTRVTSDVGVPLILPFCSWVRLSAKKRWLHCLPTGITMLFVGTKYIVWYNKKHDFSVPAMKLYFGGRKSFVVWRLWIWWWQMHCGEMGICAEACGCRAGI